MFRINHFLFLFTLLFSISVSTAQSIQLDGFITDSLQNPLVNTNVIATALQESNAQIKFSISSSKGEYRLKLESNLPYLIKVRYLRMRKKEIQWTFQLSSLLLPFMELWIKLHKYCDSLRLNRKCCHKLKF